MSVYFVKKSYMFCGVTKETFGAIGIRNYVDCVKEVGLFDKHQHAVECSERYPEDANNIFRDISTTILEQYVEAIVPLPLSTYGYFHMDDEQWNDYNIKPININETVVRTWVKKHELTKMLVGNTLPTSLIRRKCSIIPISDDMTKIMLNSWRWKSFWGHANTVTAVKEMFGVDVTPETERPAISLSPDSDNSRPNDWRLGGEDFRYALIISPSYKGTYRPQVGEEVPVEKISGWQCMLYTLI